MERTQADVLAIENMKYLRILEIKKALMKWSGEFLWKSSPCQYPTHTCVHGCLYEAELPSANATQR